MRHSIRFVNRLAAETSPYLRQHADNPVDWHPWGDEAFEEARARDVPVFLSVGYSACHWCHVMAHESFEDQELARMLNQSFVAVKVDREERPDVDAVYMDAVQAITGRGGWPMSVFITPDGRPFYGGTYFPPRPVAGMPGFGDVLDAITGAWRNRRDEVEKQADALADAISRRTELPDVLAQGRSVTEDLFSGALLRAVDELKASFDPDWGGFGAAPKFPQPGLIELCLRHHRLTGDEGSLAMASRTLDAMAAGGMYDHIGGGFARYSTETTWTVPHFEKMLYDQAGLVRAYVHGWLLTGRAEWLAVVEETIAYVLRDLRSPAGGLYCAEDADSEGEEGLFYLWTQDQLAQVLGPDDAPSASAWYGVDTGPNFEGRSILRRPLGAALLRPPEVERARAALEAARAKRVRPGLDDKVLTEWNAMFCSSMAEAASAARRTDWATAAVQVAEFLWRELRRSDGRWLRSWQAGSARHLAYSADYAWVVDCFTRVYELTGEQRWLTRASEVASAMLALFADAGATTTATGGPLATTGVDAPALVVRPMEVLDGATPSATAVAGTALVRLGALVADAELSRAGERLLGSLAPLAGEHPLAVATAVAGAELVAGGLTEVVVTGDRPDLLEAVRSRYEPGVVVAWGEAADTDLWRGRAEGMAYVCRHYVCAAPAATAEEVTLRLDAEVQAQRAKFGGGPR